MDNDSNTGIIIGIIIFTILFLFFAVIIIAIARSDKSSNNASVITEVGGFLAPCTAVPCNGEFVCDGATFTCKSGTGAPCTDATDCISGLLCSGICDAGPTGIFDALCPCNPHDPDNPYTNLICTSFGPNTKSVCKGAPGYACTADTDCASGYCNILFEPPGTCAAGLPFGYPCTSASQCAQAPDSVCSNGFCQLPQFVTGQVGAACSNPLCVSWVGAPCISPAGNNACDCLNGYGVPGTCVASTQGIYAPCSPTNGCIQDLLCITQRGFSCGPSDNTCFCNFPYFNPNASPENVCIVGMTALAAQCYNNDGLGCFNGGDCASETCGGASVLAAYVFGTEQIGNIGTTFLGATNTEIIPVSVGPSTSGVALPLSPYKMFAYTSQGIDNVYLVDHMQGFWLLSYNPIQGMIIAPWTQLLPLTAITTTGSGNSRVTTKQTVIDVAFNGTTWLVAYQQSVTSVTGTVSSNTLYSGPNLLLLTPYNVTSGVPGTQFTSNGTPLTIQYIDISRANDVSNGGDVLIVNNGTIYVKAASATLYNIGVITGGNRDGQLMTGMTGLARFYYDIEENPNGTPPASCPGVDNSPIQCSSFNNIAFIGSYSGVINVLQFSGNMAGFITPTDRIGTIQYQVFDFAIPYTPGGMVNTAIITLSNAYNGIVS